MVVAWIRAGEDSECGFPIAARTYHHLHEFYDFELEGGAALSANIQHIPRHLPRSDMIRTADLASFLTEEFGSTVLQNFVGGPAIPSRRPARAVRSAGVKLKRASKQEKAEASAALRKKNADEAEAWNAVDHSIHQEFAKLAALLQHESHSVVPAGYIPKRTEAEMEEVAIGRLLGEEASRPGHQTTSETLPESSFKMPALGAALDETTYGYFPLCYPHLFPCGEGDFNEQRAQAKKTEDKLLLEEWLNWVLWQDHGTYCAAPCVQATAPPTTHTLTELINVARASNSVVFF
jgi:hypothetical protein